MTKGEKRGVSLNVAMVAKVIGWLLMIESVFMAFPMIASLIYGEMGCVKAFLMTIGITLFSGVLMTFGIHAQRTSMRTREGLLLTASVWVVLSVFGSLPFLFSGTLTSVVDAYFETMSGFSTTGITMIDNVESAPHGILLWRSITQWLGGMGIILFTLAVLPMLNHTGGVQLFNAEVTGITHDKLRPRVSQTATSLWVVYIVLTVVLFFLLWAGPMDFFDALNHTLATTSTGGFSTKNDSIAYWNSTYVIVVVGVFMFLCGMNFQLLYRFAKGDRKAVFKNDTFRWMTAYFLIIGIMVGIKVMLHSEPGERTNAFLSGIFQTISAATSTGFSAFEHETYGGFVIYIFFIVMIFGASAGSTSGGAKIDRLVLLLKNTSIQIYHLMHPNTVKLIRINDKVVSDDVYAKAVAFLSTYAMLVTVSGAILTLFGMPAFDAIFASLSAMSNIGLGCGVTGVDGSFTTLCDVSKSVLIFDMLAGRLELFTVLIIFTRGFWKNN
ncbi:MAG: TrkH family potassium uptake protein [Bacteroidales bacterium]|nr:TrkH family potassium uptake protein [Bacteroidales bacterium]